MYADLVWHLFEIIIIFSVVMGLVAYLTLMERRFLGFFQLRLGPNRVGPMGLLQPIADGLKLFFKEDMIVLHARPFYFVLAPFISFMAVALCFAVVPFSGTTYIADIPTGVLYLMAVSSGGVYGILLGGWSSNNKYSTLGAYRAAAQMISYEIPLALALAGILILSGSFSLVEIVNSQDGMWNIIKQPLGLVIYAVCVLAETNRTPFDFMECENELVAGYQTEYSSMKFGMFYMAEYAHILLASCLITVFYLGGWYGPVLPAYVWFFLKVFLVVFLFIWIRATFPRLRYDQLMALSWKVLLPLSFLNLIATALWIVVV